jgi:hypothetical protein
LNVSRRPIDKCGAGREQRAGLEQIAPAGAWACEKASIVRGLAALLGDVVLHVQVILLAVLDGSFTARF